MARFLLIFVLLFSGCSTISGWRDAAVLKAGYTSKARAEGLLEQVKREYADKLAANAKDIEIRDAAFVQGLRDEIQSAANSLYAAHLARILNAHPDRTHLVVDNKVVEAQAALKVAPTLEAMATLTAEIVRQLDETQTSLEQLQSEHDAALKQAVVVSERATKAEDDLTAAKKAKLDIEAAGARDLAAKQDALNQANDKVIAAEHKRGDDADARHKMMEKISLYLGIFAVVCLAGAVYLPVYKVQTGLLGIVVGFAAVAIWYITPTVALVGGIAILVSVLALIYSAVRQHSTATKTTTALVNAVQDIKEKAPEVYDATVKPALTEWTTKYAKDASGATVAVPDKTVQSNLDAQLVTSNRV